MVESARVIGRYAIHGKIASGGMASVHFGRLNGSAGFSRTVAVKRLHPHLAEDPEFLSTMIDEARLAARIHHPNVVPMLDVVATDGELLLVMEYVRGESLGRLLNGEAARNGRVPLPIASAIAIATLHGLHAAHEATSDQGAPLGIVHRDVSPQNILVGVDGVARVIDFGVAKAAGRLQTTREGTIKGKIAYMAPEQLAAQQVTRAADVYAMGVVVWEMMTGKRLFQGETDVALVSDVLAGAKQAPSHFAPNVPIGIDAIVMRALAVNPAHRFATTCEMAGELLRVLPPAFPTDVGAWCEEVAREALAKRWAQVAEIESGSGTGTAHPPPSLPDVASRSATVLDPATADPEDEPSASQPSNLSMETPRPSVTPQRHPRPLAVTAVVGGLLALAALAAVPRARAVHSPASMANETPTAPTPPQPSSSSTSAAAEAQPAEKPAPVPTITPPLPTSAGPASTTAPSTRARPVSVLPRPPAAGLPDPPKSKAGCDTPYEFDSNGKKLWKRECL